MAVVSSPRDASGALPSELVGLARRHGALLLAAGAAQSAGDLRGLYTRSLPLLRFLPVLAPGCPVAHLGELSDFEAVASLCDAGREAKAAVLQPLVSLPRARRRSLIATLRLRVEVTPYATRIAAALGVSRLTADRRLRAIELLTGCCLDEPRDVARLTDGYRALRLMTPLAEVPESRLA